MKANGFFSLRRVGLLLRMEAIERWRFPSLLVAGSCMIGIFLLMSVAKGYFGRHFDHLGAYAGILHIGGAIITSQIFFPFHQKERNIPALLLPASLFEKGLALLVLSFAGWVLYTLLVYLLFSLLSTGLNLLLWDFSTPLFRLDKPVGERIRDYLVIHSLFFLGAAIFRKTAFFKTLLSLMGVTLLLVSLALLLSKFFSSEILVPFFRDKQNFRSSFGFHNLPSDGWRVLLGVFCYGLLPLFCWATAILRLREIEVKDGI